MPVFAGVVMAMVGMEMAMSKRRKKDVLTWELLDWIIRRLCGR